MPRAPGFGMPRGAESPAVPGSGGYTGPAGTAEHAAAGGTGPVPVETEGGAATAGRKRRSATGRRPGRIGRTGPLNLLALASLPDLGYALMPRAGWASGAASAA